MTDELITPGRDYTLSIVYKNDDQTLFNWTGFDAKMQLRRNVGNTGVPIYEANSQNGGITITPTTSTIDIFIGKDITSKFLYDVVGDLVIFSNDSAQTILSKTFKLDPGVTIV